MPSTTVAAIERASLCDTFDEVGPDAPTLCDPWLTRDLAAHLIIRETRPDLTFGQWVPILSERLEREQADLAETVEWSALVDRIRTGPPSWHPTKISLVDEAMNGLEFFIHHEDVLRGTPGFIKRELDPDVAKGVWNALKRMSKMLFRKVDAGLVLAAPGFGRVAVRTPTKKGSVTLTGAPGELALHAFGRGQVADVDARGSKEAILALDLAAKGL